MVSIQTGIVYHVSCHRCYQCGKQLSPGEKIIVDDTTHAVSCLTHTTNNNGIEREQQLLCDRILEAEPNSPPTNITLEQLLAFPFENGQDADDESETPS
ncbi:Mechanosensory protein 3 [Toxocara canis]|uniref:Mechanosensory protein 3 n=1 Tax=Toxocara canis TaxID=6265 RepID=A0A0B2W465_TOXCA|nr:Mechanosensory protein 3 [Toxocara canis]